MGTQAQDPPPDLLGAHGLSYRAADGICRAFQRDRGVLSDCGVLCPGGPAMCTVVTVPPTHPRRLYMLPSIWPHLLNLHYPVQAPTASQSPGLFQQPPPGSACPHYHCQPPSHPPPSLCSLVRPCPFSVVHSPMAPTYLANQVLLTCPILFCLPG